MAIAKIRRGMNMEGSPWEPGKGLATDEYMGLVHDTGFDHVRLPFPFREGTEDREGPAYYERIRSVCETALRNGLVPMVDVHPFYKINREPDKYREAFLRLWDEMADYLQDMDGRVIFELLNEPSDGLNFELLNQIQNEAIRLVRRTNPTRTIAVASAHCNTIENLCHLVLPDDDGNLLVTVHDYTPMPFTHQGADWVKPGFEAGRHWGTPEEYALLERRMDMAKQWADEHGRPIQLGEFGVYSRAGTEDRCRWTRHMVRLCEERGFAWCYWEFCAGFGAYDRKNAAWNPILDALIPSDERGDGEKIRAASVPCQA